MFLIVDNSPSTCYITTMKASYRKHNDRSLNSSTYHKKDCTNVRAILKTETQTEIDEAMNPDNSDLDPQDSNYDLAHQSPEEQPYDGWGGCWPGDGSGCDDLADYNQMEAYDYMDE